MDARFSLPFGCSLGILDSVLEDILSLIRPVEEDRIRRFHVINEFRAIVGSVPSLKGATVEPFGSFVSNLYTKWGDLDISIELPNGSHTSVAKRQKQNLLRDTRRVLSLRGGARDLQLILNARVPLLIFESNRYNISCDVSISNRMGLIKSKVLLWITEIDGRFRDMVLLIKEWAKEQNIKDPKNGTLNSYSLCLLVIFHFQTCTPAILPPMRDIYDGNISNDLTGTRDSVERRIHDICVANIARFRSRRFRQVNKSSLSELVIGFFSKFSGIHTISEDYVVCTYTGRWELKGNDSRWMVKPYNLFIEDPFEQPENAARTVSLSQLSRISDVILETHRKLSSRTTLLDRNSLLGALIKPHTSLGLELRSRLATAASMPDNEYFEHALRLESRPSSSTTTLQRPTVITLQRNRVLMEQAQAPSRPSSSTTNVQRPTVITSQMHQQAQAPKQPSSSTTTLQNPPVISFRRHGVPTVQAQSRQSWIPRNSDG